MVANAQIPVEFLFDDGDDMHLARLSIDDMNRLASTWRTRAEDGDEGTVAVATALASVARKRRVAAVARGRILAAYRTWRPLRKIAEWIWSHHLR